MPPRRKGGFFAQTDRPEDEAARQREVEALITVRRTFPQEVSIERIKPNPFQARHDFPDLPELAEAIRQQGFTSRLRVRPDPAQPGFFQLVYGERRLRAARLAGLTEVPCDVAEHSDDELIEIGLAENIQRRDLAPLEEAQALQNMINQRGYSIRRLAERLGKDKSYVEDRLKLLQVPDDVQRMVEQRPDSLRAAREIAKLETAAERAPLIAGVVSGELSTADIRRQTRTTHSTQTDIQQTIEHDTRVVREILERWRTVLLSEAQAREFISEHAQTLLRELQQLVEINNPSNNQPLVDPQTLEELYPLKDIAEEFGLSYNSLRGYANRGRLRAIKFGNQWAITRQAIEEYLSSRNFDNIPKKYRKSS